MTDKPNDVSASAIRTPAINERKSKRTLILKIIASVFLAIGIFYALYYFLVLRFYVSTDDAYVNGNPIALTPQVNGIVKQILADDTQLVQAGQKVVVLDPTDSYVALKQAEAALAESVRQIREDFLQVDQLAAVINQRQADLQRAESDYTRRAKLKLDLSVSKEDLDHSKQNYYAAQAALLSAEKQYQSTKSLVQNTTVDTHPTVLKARAALEQAYLAWKRTEIIAPITGYIAKRNVQIGQQVGVGDSLLAIVPLNDLWIDANFRESQLGDIRINQPVKITTDIYGSDVVYHGKIIGISAGSGSAFSLLPAQNASGNWIKVVQRVPVKISLDPGDLQKHPLFLGLSTYVEVDTHNRDGKILSTVSTTTPVYQTTIYDSQLQEARNISNAIIQEQTQSSLPGELPTPPVESNTHAGPHAKTAIDQASSVKKAGS